MKLTLLYIPVLFGVSIEVYFILLIIAVSTFFFWKWALRKFIRSEGKRRLLTWVVTILFTPVIYTGLIFLFMLFITYTPSRDFSRSAWLEDIEGRFQMADDIIDSKMLLAKDTGQVKQLLGNPTWGGDQAWRTDTTNTWGYNMGMGGGGLGFMFNTLVVKFNGRQVVSVEHLQVPD